MTLFLQLIASALLLVSAGALCQPAYSPGGWPTLHHDAGNRRAVSARVVGRDYHAWQALAGASVLTAPVASPDGQQLYLTTGRAAGASNLHAFSRDGKLLWQSDPWQDADHGVDACAILSSPIVDAAGDLYVSDCNQLFAYRADGSIKWIQELPPPQPGDWAAAGDHPVNAFTTAVFTTGGEVLGVTNFGDVVVADRNTGKLLNEPFRLPAANAPYSVKHPLPDTLLDHGLMDARFREWAWQLIFGGNMRSANTPAVAASGRVYVVGSSNSPGVGALYGLDVDTAQSPYLVRVAFATEIGIGSGSSPALSPDERQVYVSDEEGWFYAIDGVTGEVLWRVKTAAAAGAAAVGRDGTIYALQEFPAPALIALDDTGAELWQSDIAGALTGMPDSFLFGEAVGAANGNPTVTADAVLVPVSLGYQAPLLNVTLPVQSVLLALDKRSGRFIARVADLPDDSSGITAVLPDGTLINSLGAVLTSSVNPLKALADLLLPGDLTLLPPRGGVQVSLPVSQ